MNSFKEIDLSKVKRYSIENRKSKVDLIQQAKVVNQNSSLALFFDSLPRTLKVRELFLLSQAVRKARSRGRPVIVMMGAHPIKCGLSPVLIDLIAQGYISHLATNGAGAIHDYEMAFWGQTSEDVAAGLEDGSFGMAKETADGINGIIKAASLCQMGYGQALGQYIIGDKAKYQKFSLLAACSRNKVPFTVHVAVGTDIINQHFSYDGAAVGDCSHRDFKILAQAVTKLPGGVVINIGSAVVLPEVFLKALTVARNLGHQVRNFTTANFDMIQHYRPNVNVVSRPVLFGGQGYSFTGHHEIMLPLLAALIKLQDKKTKTKINI
ncbi:hypothetical protein HY768_08035 [candidate division TA06 bacterium]|uniref:Deoxyhypusine synthase n=1 Tax=candidate division TA06 bacterium TaxID=2250710 RepID=A0A933IBD8_UNCT6|nr:hypothetical protein [candidate division TA06 bacterium]